MPLQSNRDDARARGRCKVGDWIVDPATNELIRPGETVRIEPKAMDVLMVLAGQPGRVVGRDELLAAVWPAVVVGDEALTQSIIKLRRALGDDSRSPTYIETISKRGYRLIAAVVPRDPSGSAAAEAATAGGRQPAQRVRSHARPVAWVAGLLLATGMGGTLYYLSQPSDTPAMQDLADVGDVRQSAWVTVAVVPFEALGSDREQAYFARGISETLSYDLSRVSGLRVIRGSGVANATSADGVARYRVTGSVRRDSESLRIDIQLVDTRTNEQLWSSRLERPYRDLFAVQNEIAATMLELLPAKVGEIERRRVAARYTSSLEAYDNFLRGQAMLQVRRNAENEQARAYYRKALELDPKFARAYASLALTYALEERLGAQAADSRALVRALELAETSRQIDPEVPEVYWALGFVHAQGRRHKQAIESLQRAIQLDRSYADGYALLGGVYTYVGRPAESIPLLRTAMRLNPEGGYLYFLLLGRAYLFADDVEQSLINLRAAAMRNPVDVETHAYLAAALVAAGDRNGAKWEADEIRALVPGFSARKWLAAYPMTDARQAERLVQLLGAAGL